MRAPHEQNVSTEERQLERSLRLRFAAYVLCLLAAIAACLLLLLTVTGALNPVGREIEQTLDLQLENAVDRLSRDIDEAAANGIALSRELSRVVDAQLASNDMSFDDLLNDADALERLQAQSWNALVGSMRATSCSGAFFILDTTANDTADVASRSGLYLRYANLNAESTVSNRISLFRGAYSVAREKGANLNSSWQLETAEGTFPQMEALLDAATDSLAHPYTLTETYDLPDTWESARFICIPVESPDGRIVGVCGYEMCDLYFQIVYQALDVSHEHTAYALLDSAEADTRGCMAGSQSGYAPLIEPELSVEQRDGFAYVSAGENNYVGRMAPLDASFGPHVVAALMPIEYFNELASSSQAKMALSLAAALVLALALSWIAGRRFVAPVATKLAHLRMQAEDERVETKRRMDELDALANRRIAALGGARMQEVRAFEYRAFEAGLETLTPKERAIYDLHVRDMSTPEILERTGISQNTLKYHNRNIYAKLGVSGRKQLQLFAEIHAQMQNAE